MKNILPGFVQISPSLERSCGVISAPPGRFILPLVWWILLHQIHYKSFTESFWNAISATKLRLSPCYYSKPSEGWRSEGLKLKKLKIDQQLSREEFLSTGDDPPHHQHLQCQHRHPRGTYKYQLSRDENRGPVSEKIFYLTHFCQIWTEML